MADETIYVVYFKTGAKVGVRAKSWHYDSSSRICFDSAETNRQQGKPEFHINSGEVLYVVPFDSVADTPLSVK